MRTREALVRLRCRPITLFPPEFHALQQSSQFSAAWTSTLNLLDRELDKLGARDAVIELAVTEGELRIDGFPYADARPSHPGVIVSFDSKHGPLRYGTDAFSHWQENVRAIALGLEALRKVDRYGIGKRGEQYVGWRQLSAGDSDLEQRGREIIADHGGETAALKATHPDRGGSPDDFRAVQAARSR
jgi:hypothetical protein